MKHLKIIHCLQQDNLSSSLFSLDKTVIKQQDTSFLLTNNIGSFLWLAEKPFSHYQGWFFTPIHLRGQKMFKIIENIEIKQGEVVSEIKNNFWNIERKRGKIIERFSLFEGINSLVYEIESDKKSFSKSSSQKKNLIIELFLDIRDVYQNIKWGREYKFYFEDDILIIEYCQSDLEISPVFLVIKSSQAKIKKIKNWLPRKYDYDFKRQGNIEEKWVFQACQVVFENLGKIVLSVSTNKNKAIQESKYVFNNLSYLKQKEKERSTQLLKKFYFKLDYLNLESRVACICAFDALRKMAIFHSLNNKMSGLEDKNDLAVNQGIFAGLPWFFQFWVRDEAICLKSFSNINQEKAKKFLFQELSLIDGQGYIDGTSDGVGWTFKRVADFLEKKLFNNQEKQIIIKIIEKTIDGLLKYYTQDGFALSLKQQTWMDSLDRSGVRLEIQALRLNIYQLAYSLTNKKKYLILEQRLVEKVKQKFYNSAIGKLQGSVRSAGSYNNLINKNRKKKKILIDGWDKEGVLDETLRSNVFLAFYIYPDLLDKEEWKNCLENSLPRLWLEWGGISSLDRKNKMFHRLHTGEIADSYHQGDSWFWVNNLSGIVLDQIDKSFFQLYSHKILKASSDDILWQGIIAHHSELSSAECFQAQGCLAQAWSSAMFIELCLSLRKDTF